MKTKYWIITCSVIGLLGGIGAAFGDNDNDEYESRHEAKIDKKQVRKTKAGVARVENKTYSTECGACHFPYQPGLLPERSWRKLMSQLNDHFGDNAELSADKQTEIVNYLAQNSADKSDYKRSKRIMSSLSESDTPLRITETNYFKARHREVPRRLVQDNEQVKSFSRCDSCHQTANTGSFSERHIKIPGHGRWED